MNKKQIVLFSKHLNWLDWKETAATIKNMGFEGVDLNVRPGGHVMPDRVEDDLPRVIEIFEKENLSIPIITTDIWDVKNKTTERILKTASGLGINQYRLGWCYYDFDKSIIQNLKEIKSQMSEIAAMNEHYSIRGSYQNHDGAWFGSAVWDLGIVLREIDSEWLGCQYDILNATIESANSWILGLRLIAPYIYSIDIKDAKWGMSRGKQKIRYVPLGGGMVDFNKFFSVINELNINVPISLHLEYNLGGADKGSKTIRVPGQKIIDAIQNDFRFIRKILFENKPGLPIKAI